MHADWISRALREPLLQFVLIGALLFAGYRLVAPERSSEVEINRIDITADDVWQLEIAWTSQWRRPPTPEELQGLIDGRVREEILYREALGLGLDRGDTIVKRRLAQKMEFLADDVATVRDPTAEELRTWYSQNAARFAEPARRSFRHVYFATDRRGSHARDDAARTLVRLDDTPADSASLSTLGDRFMFQDFYAERAPEQVASVFGSEFAAAIEKLQPGSWQGPIESGLGWHLVFVTSAASGRVPPFEAIEAEVKAGWMDDQRAAARRRAFDLMKARYEVHLPDVTDANSTVGPRAGAARP